MSCFVRIATRLRDLDTVRQAAEELGYTVREGTSVRGWSGRTVEAALVIALTDGYDVGVVPAADGSCELVADWEMAHVDQRRFLDRMSQRYSLVQVKQKAKRAGYTIARERVDADGTVRLQLRRFE